MAQVLQLLLDQTQITGFMMWIIVNLWVYSIITPAFRKNIFVQAVTDYSEYTFNLTEANSNAESSPNWYKLYSFKDAYGLPDLTPKSLGNLYTQMASNNSDNALVDKYFRYVYRDSDVYIKEGCDGKCKKKLVCLMVASESSQSIVC